MPQFAASLPLWFYRCLLGQAHVAVTLVAVPTSAEVILAVALTSAGDTGGSGHFYGGHFRRWAGSAGASALASCLDLERPTTGIIRITPIMETASCKGGG